MILPQNKVFCDTSFFFASLAPDDSNYDRAGELLEHCKNNSVILHTTWDIICETVTLLRYRASYDLAVTFLEQIKPALLIARYNDSVRKAAKSFPETRRFLSVMLYLMLLLSICLIISLVFLSIEISEALV